jgi:hypothetical protein
MLSKIGVACMIMMTAIKNRLWLALFLGGLSTSVAQPAGRIGFDFDTSTYPVWDVSGSYLFDQPIEGTAQVPMQYAVDLVLDGSGRVRGSGSTMVQIGADTVYASYKVNGSVSGSGNDTRVNFSVRLNGQDWFQGVARKFNISVQYKLAIQSQTLLLVGTAKGNSNISGVGGGKIDSDVSMPLPFGVDGSWSVVVDLLPLKPISGTGEIQVSAFHSPETPGGWPTDRVLPVTAKGNYKSSSDTTTLQLKGTEEAKGTTLNFKFSSGMAVPQQTSGKILGQKVKTK